MFIRTTAMSLGKKKLEETTIHPGSHVYVLLYICQTDHESPNTNCHPDPEQLSNYNFVIINYIVENHL